jgi:hypothetical protein
MRKQLPAEPDPNDRLCQGIGVYFFDLNNKFAMSERSC